MNQSMVFVADDDDSFRTAITRLLRILGFQVCAYRSGAELLADVTPNSRGCVLADLCMPELDGVQLHKALRKAGVTMPVIILTGQTDPASMTSLPNDIEVLEKHTSKDELLATIQRAFTRDIETAQAHTTGPT